MDANKFSKQVANHSRTPVAVVEREMRQSLDGTLSVQVASTCYWYKDQWTVMFNGTELTAPGTLDEVWALFLEQYRKDQDEFDLKRYREQEAVNAADARGRN